MRMLERIDLLVLPQVHLMDLAGPAQVFANSRVNAELRYISPCAEIVSAQGLVIKDLQSLPETVQQHSCLLVVGSQNMQLQLKSEPMCKALSWLRENAKNYQNLAAVCSGSLLLGCAGLLDFRTCTTHHDLIQQLQQVAPQAKTRENVLFVEDEHIITSAGISTGVDLSLHLVQMFWGAAISQQIARDMVVYQRRSGEEKSLSFWLQHRNHLDNKIHAIQDRIMQSPSENWPVSELARIACLSERHFRRKFQQATGTTLQNYIQCARLELCKQLLRQTSLLTSQIAERCGFADERSLRRLFQTRLHLSPSEYRAYQKP